MNKFMLGAVSGLGAVALAIPVLMQVTSAQSVGSSSSSGTTTPATKPIPTTQCISALAALEGQQISLMDGQEAARKSALQAHVDALNAAASITDDTARQAAIQKANQDLRTAMKASVQQNQTSLQTYRQAVQTACGNAMHGEVGGGFNGFMDKPMMGRGSGMNKQNMLNTLATKLGITTAQLQSELQSGKTLQQIAQEHGVTIPTRPQGGFGHGKWGMNNQNQTPSSSPAAPTQS
ncbi:MAG TPA: hypothetical protein VHA78_03055 [Candidatus Peribacteraceae bacterium]|nr:hypothetical protein [Candidatus Peribacteraceae bacterium]